MSLSSRFTNVGFGLKVVIVERSTNRFWSNFVLSIPPVSFESISHRVGVTFRSHGTTQSLIFKKVNGAGPQGFGGFPIPVSAMDNLVQNKC